MKITTSLKAHPALHNKSDRDWRKVTEDDAVMFIYREPVYTSVFIVLLLTEKYFPHLFSGARCVGEVHVCFFSSLYVYYISSFDSPDFWFSTWGVSTTDLCAFLDCVFFLAGLSEKNWTLVICYFVFIIDFQMYLLFLVSRCFSMHLFNFVVSCNQMGLCMQLGSWCLLVVYVWCGDRDWSQVDIWDSYDSKLLVWWRSSTETLQMNLCKWDCVPQFACNFCFC